MPNSCFRGRQNCREVVHPVAIQLIVTHAGRPPAGDHPPNEWEFSNPRFNGQKRSEIRPLAIDLGFAEIWLAQSLVNGGQATSLEPLERFGTLVRACLQGWFWMAPAGGHEPANPGP